MSLHEWFDPTLRVGYTINLILCSSNHNEVSSDCQTQINRFKRHFDSGRSAAFSDLVHPELENGVNYFISPLARFTSMPR